MKNKNLNSKNKFATFFKNLFFLKSLKYWIPVLVLFLITAVLFFKAGINFDNAYKDITVYTLLFIIISGTIALIYT